MSFGPLAARSHTLALLSVALPLAATAPADAGTLTTLYNFTDKADGGNPMGGVIQDAAGTIYGETYLGGVLPCTTEPHATEGCGTVYSLSPSTGFKVLADFTGANGAHGNIRMVRIGTTLYGATQKGGANNDGVIFSVNIDGSDYTLLHQFSGPDGANPIALVTGNNVLYGVTKFGGVSNAGVLFSLAPGGVYTVLHKFALPISAVPNALLLAPGSTLVGSTFTGGNTSSACHSGCGTLFSYATGTAKFTTLFTLPSSDFLGASPYVGSLGPGPTIFGANLKGVFSLSQQNGYIPGANFNNYTVGSGTTSGPLYTPGGTLYGVVAGGPVTYEGALYKIENGAISDAAIFAGSPGTYPVAEPTLTPDGTLIGTTSENGACFHCGAIWRYTP